MMNILRGLKFGGRVRRDLAAYDIAVPLVALHRPDRLCWSWFLEWYRAKPASGERHHFFRVLRLPGHQSRLIVDVLALGSLHFVRQHEKT